MKCFANLGTPDTPKQCKNEAAYHYITDTLLSHTYLCTEHSKEADNSRIVQAHLIKKEEVWND